MTPMADDADGAGASHQCCGERCVVAGLDHAGDQHQAQSGNGGRTGTGDGSEEACHDDADDGQTAFDVSHAGVCQVDQALGDAGLLHDVAGQDEERDGQQYELTGGCREDSRQTAHNGGYGVSGTLHQHRQDTGGTETHRDGRAQEQQDGKGDKQDTGYHFISSSLSRAASAASSICTSSSVRT